MFEIYVEEANEEKSLLALNVQGSLDSASFLDFYDYIIEHLNKGFSLFILDFSKLQAISSAGISVLLRVKNKLDEKNSFLVFFQVKQEIFDLFQFLGLHKNFLIANSAKELTKVLESLNILKKSNPEEVVVSNRFGLVVEEEQDEFVFEEEMAFQQTESSSFQKESSEFATTPEFEEVPFVEEIQTEPFVHVEEKNLDFTMPFFSKSNEDTKEIPQSILEKAFPSKEEFHEVKVNCGKCGIQMRILSQGIHLCPNCKSRFALRQSGSISTIEKLP